MKRLVQAIAFLGALIGHVQAQSGGIAEYNGWWVVLGSFADPYMKSDNEDKIRAIRIRVAKCGVVPFNDFSGKFIGFAPGYDVAVVGAYSRSIAQTILARVRPCVPGAYIKHGRYAGE
jgi:hypothetical protein